MQPPDRSTLDAIAYGIAYPLLGDATGARSLAERAVAWLEAHADETGAQPAAWLAATTVERSLATPPPPRRSHDAERRTLAAVLATQPIGGRVAFALVGLCGYDHPTVAALTRRPLPEVAALLAPFESLAPMLPGLRERPARVSHTAEPTSLPGTSTRTTPPPPPPPFRTDVAIVADHHLPASPVAAQPGQAEQPPQLEPATPRARRRFRMSAGTVTSLVAVAALVALITIPHGERPSFAEAARLRGSTDAGTDGGSGPCDGATDGAPRRLDLGGSHPAARFFLPPGTNREVPLVLLVGDARQPADEIASTSGLEGAGATQGFAVLTLDGSAQDWNVAGAAGRSDDVALIRTAIDAADRSGCIDGARVVLVGYGRGAHLAAAAACRDATSIAGIAMVRGAYVPPGCSLRVPIPLLMDTDTTDAVLPFDGGWGSSAPSDPAYTPTGVGDTFDRWSELDGCDATSSTATDPSGAVVTTRARCADGAVIESLVSTGYGHTWPTDLLPRLTQAIAAWT